jgi:hypothetical protein
MDAGSAASLSPAGKTLNESAAALAWARDSLSNGIDPDTAVLANAALRTQFLMDAGSAASLSPAGKTLNESAAVLAWARDSLSNGIDPDTWPASLPATLHPILLGLYSQIQTPKYSVHTPLPRAYLNKASQHSSVAKSSATMCPLLRCERLLPSGPLPRS